MSKIFDNQKQAKHFILDTHQKYDKAIAVKAKENNKLVWVVGGWAAS